MIGITKLAVISSLLVLTGCMTEATQERFTAEGAASHSCQSKVLDARVAIAKYKSEGTKNQTKVLFKDERNALTYLMVKQMGNMNVAMIEAFTAKSDGLETCDDVIIAMVRSDAAKVAGINSTSKTAISWIAGLVGLGIISDNWGPEAYGSSTAKTQNNYNSRVVSDSNASGGSSISASGTGLGVGNTSTGGDGVGGFYPRSQMDLINDNGGSQSNSGELKATFPVEALPAPEQLPE